MNQTTQSMSILPTQLLKRTVSSSKQVGFDSSLEFNSVEGDLSKEDEVKNVLKLFQIQPVDHLNRNLAQKFQQ